MLPENDSEREVGKLSPLEVLVERFAFDPALSGLLMHLAALHGRTGQPVAKPFDGSDHSEPLPVLLCELLVLNQALLLEVRTANHGREKRPGPGWILAESKTRELEMVLVQATRLAVDIHMHLSGVG